MHGMTIGVALVYACAQSPPVRAGCMSKREQRQQRVTMTQVAELARVSPSTVSLFLRDPGRVASATVRAIESAIDALGYVPNAMAGGLAGGGGRLVGVVVPSVRNAFFAETILGLQETLAPEGLQVMLGNTGYDSRAEQAIVRSVLSWKPAAMVLTGLAHDRDTVRALRQSAVPVIETWEIGAQPLDLAIGFSHEAAGAAAARHLYGRGRRRLAFLGARLADDARARQRSQGFLAAATGAGAEAVCLDHPAPAGAQVGTILLDRLLREGPAVDGLSCSNDLVALGVLFECQRRGLQVPGDLAVIGFGDQESSAYCNPTLTTIKPSGRVIGEEAGRQILARLAGQQRGDSNTIDTGFSLIQRCST